MQELVRPAHCTCRHHTWGLIRQLYTDILTHTHKPHIPVWKNELLTTEAPHMNDDYERKATVVEKLKSTNLGNA